MCCVTRLRNCVNAGGGCGEAGEESAGGKEGCVGGRQVTAAARDGEHNHCLLVSCHRSPNLLTYISKTNFLLNFVTFGTSPCCLLGDTVGVKLLVIIMEHHDTKDS